MAQTLTIDVQQKKLADVLTLIEEQTGYEFNYTEPPVNASETVSLKVSGKSLTETLDLLFKSKSITYRIIGKKIFLTEAPAVELSLIHI